MKKTWTQKDYKKAKTQYYRHQLMTRVVEAILASGVSYTDIAKRSGVAQSTVQNWVSGGTMNGKLDTVARVLEALGLTLTLTSTMKTNHREKSSIELRH